MTIWGFPNLSNNLLIMRSPTEPSKITPFRVVVENGLIVDYDKKAAPEDFGKLLEKISAEDGCVRIREFGLGLNRAMDLQKVVSNTTAFERQHGLHLSIGRLILNLFWLILVGNKHTIFKKRHNKRLYKSRWHKDLFLDVQAISVDSVPIYSNKQFLIPNL